MNRHERRRARKFYEDYVRHLLANDSPFEPGIMYHMAVMHDDWCNQFRGGQCNCNLIIERYTEPRRS